MEVLCLADVGKGVMLQIEEHKDQKPESKRIGNPQNCKLLNVTRAQGIGRGKPREPITGPNFQGKGHFTREIALGQWRYFDGF